MKKQTWINIAAVAVGVPFGPSALASAKASQPPINWSAIPFVFVGCVVGTVFIIGLQILRSDPKHARLVLALFTPMSTFFIGSGIGALAVSAIGSEFGPTSIFFAAIGIGLVVGVLLSGIAYRAKFKNAL